MSSAVPSLRYCVRRNTAGADFTKRNRSATVFFPETRQTQLWCPLKAVCLPDHLLTLLSLLNKQCPQAVFRRAAGPEHSSSRMDGCVRAAYTALMGNIWCIWRRRATCLEVCSENQDIGDGGWSCVYRSAPSVLVHSFLETLDDLHLICKWKSCIIFEISSTVPQVLINLAVVFRCVHVLSLLAGDNIRLVGCNFQELCDLCEHCNYKRWGHLLVYSYNILSLCWKSDCNYYCSGEISRPVSALKHVSRIWGK